jgi:glycosyltransferase involved in cell wall biosynthesis
LITTIIPVYIRDEGDLYHLNRALESIITQTQKPNHVIISDDSNREEYIERLKLLLKDVELTIEYVKNPGRSNASDNTNFAVHKATSEIIHILHQDDWLVSPTYYEEIQEAISIKNFPWTLAKGVTSKSQNIPKIKPALIFGFNSIGGPSALAMKREFWINLNSEFLLLPDVIQFAQLSEQLGSPYVTSDTCIEYGTGDHKMTHRISKDDVRQDISKLFSLELVEKLPFTTFLLNYNYWGSYLENLSACISNNPNLGLKVRLQANILNQVCRTYLYLIKVKISISSARSKFHKRNHQ